MFRKKRRRSRKDLEAVVKKAAEEGTMDEIDEEEVTDVIDLVAERVKRTHEECQRETDSAVEKLKGIRLPKPGPAESAG
jgi:hypothetical protein